MRKGSLLMVLLLSALIPLTMLSGCGEKESTGETIANAFIEGVSAMYDDGAEYDTYGLTRLSGYMYGTAAASACAMRYAVDCLLYMKGEGSTLDEVVGDRLCDWDGIAALGYASPFPYCFEGIILEADGKTDEANACYAKAAYNPILVEGSSYLKTVIDLDVAALKRIKEKLVALEDKIFSVYPAESASLYPRNEDGFYDGYWRVLAAQSLKDNPDDLDAALGYYIEALKVNPFNGDNYAACVLVYIDMEDAQSALDYLNDGLFIDPECEALQKIATAFEGVMKE